MKLYITATSPYARMARIVLRAKGLSDRVEEVLAVTRQPDSPFYRINPSGRVPCLVLDDGRVMEDSILICDYLDELDGNPAFARPMDDGRWDYALAEARARSTLDGLAVLVRELRRPENERSPGIIAHEISRAERMLESCEGMTDLPALNGPLNYAQMLLVCVVDAVRRTTELDLTGRWPRLVDRVAEIGKHPAVAATAPPV